MVTDDNIGLKHDIGLFLIGRSVHRCNASHPPRKRLTPPSWSQIEHNRNNSKAGRTWEINKCEECFTFRICLSVLALLFLFALRDRLNKSLMPPCEHLTKVTAPGLTTRTIYVVLTCTGLNKASPAGSSAHGICMSITQSVPARCGPTYSTASSFCLPPSCLGIGLL